MIKIYLTLLGLLLFSIGNSQEYTKEETKEAKKEIKALLKNPEKYIVLKNESQEKTKIIGDQQEDINELKSQVAISNMEYLKLKNSLQTTPTAPAVTKSQTNIAAGNYRVQIGLFSNFDISDLLNSP